MLYATFVVPAPNGCNLRCPFCAIAQRREALRSELSHEDYIRFLSDTLVHLKVGRVSIQGYEPLLPEAWPLTRRLLRIAGAFFCETSLITNGVNLAGHASELSELLDSATVSLDSDKPEVHDKLRGVSGSHAKALAGLHALSAAFSGKDITVNSVLFPGKAHYLSGMPELLASAGVTGWLVSPMIDFKKGRHIPNPEFIRDTILSLADKAAGYGVKVFLSDELRGLEETANLYEVMSVQALEDGDELFRLSPDASCSRGKEALGMANAAPKWDRVTEPHVFLQKIFGEVDQPLRERKLRFAARTLLRLAERADALV